MSSGFGSKIGDEFISRVLERIDLGLDHFGRTMKEVVYWNFESDFKLTKRDIVNHPEKFVQSIRDVFGSGSLLIEKTIIQEMTMLPELGKVDPTDLVVALKQARAHYQRRKED